MFTTERPTPETADPGGCAAGAVNSGLQERKTPGVGGRANGCRRPAALGSLSPAGASVAPWIRVSMVQLTR